MIAPAVNRYGGLLAAVNSRDTLAEDESLEGLEPRPSEIEFQSRWFAGDFGRSFRTVSGQRIEIVQFGEWNRGAGPDFCGVVIDVGGRQLRGPAEIDMDARDWERHGHALNPAYDDVILHVFFDVPAERFFTRTSNHRDVIQVHLDPASLPPSRTPFESAPARRGRCSFPLREMSAAQLQSLFEAAARHRMDRKARRLARVAELHGNDQALFQELAGALGYRQNKLAMTVLAQRLPLKFLLAHRDSIEALLFGVAGFLETRVYESAADDTRDYLRRLWETWWKCRDEFTGIPSVHWVSAGCRPMNHPQRRVGALAVIAQKWKRLREAFDASPGELSAALLALSHPYWEFHFTLTSARVARPMAIVGETRVNDILANVAFPHSSRNRNDWWPAYARLPATLENAKSRRAALRLLGQRPDAASFTRKLYQQQALIQIYEDFCLRDDSDCARCLFPEQLGQWTLEESSTPD